MMQYPMPADTRDKEKLFGGIFTITQFVMFAGLSALGGLAGLGLYSLTGSLAGLAAGLMLGIGAGAPFAFYKKRDMGDMELTRYLWLRWKFKQKPKTKIHVNENYLKCGGEAQWPRR